jgi:hypothetical protein
MAMWVEAGQNCRPSQEAGAGEGRHARFVAKDYQADAKLTILLRRTIERRQDQYEYLR